MLIECLLNTRQWHKSGHMPANAMGQERSLSRNPPADMVYVALADDSSLGITSVACLNQMRFDMTAHPAKSPVVKSGRQNKARRFYQMDLDLRVRGRAGYRFENASLLLQGERLLGPPLGQRGFQDYPEPPRFLFDKKIGHFPRDLELCHSYWLVSDRMKKMLEAVDSEGVAFLRCEVRLPDGEQGPVSWLCDVLRELDAVDETASRVQIEYNAQYNYKVYRLSGGANLLFKEDVIGTAHIFRLRYYSVGIFCDEQIKDRYKAASLKGVRFTEFKDQPAKYNA